MKNEGGPFHQFAAAAFGAKSLATGPLGVRRGHRSLICGGDLVHLVAGAARSHAQLSAENLFLRKQLALYVERQVKPHRADDSTLISRFAANAWSG